MDIQFCDLCNESVPQSDLELGRAFVRRGRVICASCERAMTHTAGSASHAEESASGLTVEVEIQQAVDVLSGDPRVERPSAAPRPPAPASVPSIPIPPPEVHLAHDLSPSPFETTPYGSESTPVSSSVSHPEEIAAVAPFPSQAGGPAAAPAPRRSAGVIVGLVAIVFAAGSVAVLNESIRGNEAKATELESKLRSQTAALDDLRKANADATAQLATLKSRFASDLASEREVAEKAITELRTGAGEIRKSNEDLAHRLDEASASAAARDQEIAKRHQELATNLEKSRDDGKSVLDRISKLEEEVQRAPAPSPAAPAAADAGASKLGPLIADLQSPKAATRWEAVDQIGQMKDPDAVPHLLPLLKDVDVFVRMATARVLGDLKVTSAVPALIDALEDTEAAVREAALGALRSLTGKDLRFDPMASESERSKKVKAWREWWKKAEEEGGVPKTQG